MSDRYDRGDHQYTYPTFWSALKRDLKRAFGRERYQIRWVKTGPKTNVGRFARTDEPTTCQQCGRKGRHFHAVNSSIPYPWIWSHTRLVCHDCHVENRGVQPWTFDPQEVFAADEQ